MPKKISAFRDAQVVATPEERQEHSLDTLTKEWYKNTFETFEVPLHIQDSIMDPLEMRVFIHAVSINRVFGNPDSGFHVPVWVDAQISYYESMKGFTDPEARKCALEEKQKLKNGLRAAQDYLGHIRSNKEFAAFYEQDAETTYGIDMSLLHQDQLMAYWIVHKLFSADLKKAEETYVDSYVALNALCNDAKDELDKHIRNGDNRAALEMCDYLALARRYHLVETSGSYDLESDPLLQNLDSLRREILELVRTPQIKYMVGMNSDLHDGEEIPFKSLQDEFDSNTTSNKTNKLPPDAYICGAKHHHD